MTDERTPSNGIEDLGVTLELAKIAEQIEAQGDKQQKILISIFNQVKAIGKTGPRKVGEDQKGNNSFLLRTEKGTKRTVTASQGGTKENNKGPKKEQKGPEKDQFASGTDPQKDQNSTKKAQTIPYREQNGPLKGSGAKNGESTSSASESGVNPESARENRTITLGLPATNEVAPAVKEPQLVAEVQAEAPPQSVAKPAKAPGFYVDSAGRLRRPDGKYASKVEERRYNKQRNKDVDDADKEGKKPGLIMRALGLLDRNRKGLAGTETADAAGVAAGGSFWRAGKEIAEGIQEMKEALDNRDIRSVADAKKYAKGKAGSLWSSIKRPFQKKQEPEAAQSAAAFGSNSAEVQAKAQAKAAADQSESQHGEVMAKLDDLVDAVKPQQKGIVGTASDIAGSAIERYRKRRRSARRSTSRRRRSGRRAGGPGSIDVPDLDDYQDDGGFDIDLPDGDERDGKSRRGRHDRTRTRGRRMPRAGRAGRVGRVARLRAFMPKAMPAMASVGEAASALGGKAMAGGGAVLRGAGRLGIRGAAMGARAVPVLGQILAAGMALYDGYEGFNDSEAQQRTFGVARPEEITTGQKAATAAGRALDLGGLTSGFSGLLASGAGMLGMKNTQDMLTFSADDISRKLYDGIFADKERAALGLQDGDKASIGQSIAIGVGKGLDMGGLLTGTIKNLGKVAEDLGVEGAADATDFETSDLVTALYKVFGGDLPDDKKQPTQLITINNSRYTAPSAARDIGITEADVKRAGKQYDFSALEQEAALPEGYLSAIGGVESNLNPLATNPSGAAGMFQLMPGTAQAYGVDNPFDVNQSARAVAQFSRDNAQYFTKTMGRAPEARELYLMHQQGMGGGTKLLRNPESLAADQVGLAAVVQNGGRADMTAREFADLQMAKYDKHYMAQKMAREQGAQPRAPELARDDAVREITPSFPVPYRKDAAPSELVAKRQEIGKASAIPGPSNFAGMIDIQAEQAKSAARGAESEVTAKMDPQMTNILKSIDQTLKQQAKQPGGNNITNNNNTTNITSKGPNRTVAGHDSFTGFHADMARDRG